MNILQTFFSDYYEHIIYDLRPRRYVVENVERLIDCGDSSKGGAMFGCPLCGDLKFVPFRCKSRFCPSCGNKYNQFRSLHMSSKLISCAHRHCVFTIPEELRIYFLNDRSLLSCLFHSVRDVILRMFFKMNKTERFTPWRTVKHFDYNFLRNAFRKVLLEQLSKRLGPSFNKIKNSINKKHEDNKTITERIPALDFIKQLIIHIPEKHFKMLRYYGIYAKHHKQEKNLRKCLSPEKRNFLLQHLDWRNSILLTFGYDPLRCQKRGSSMLILEVYHKKLHYLNDIERSWDMDISISVILPL